jgi:hypothetical protein
MRFLPGRRNSKMTRTVHAGFVCAVVIFALVAPYTGRAQARLPGIQVPDGAASGQRAVAATTASQTVSYHGVQVTVPGTWPVIDLRLHPGACVRLDQVAVYLGSSQSQSNCPAHAVGRTDTIWLRDAPSGRTDPLTSQHEKVGSLNALVGVSPISHDTLARFVAQSVELEATWGKNSLTIDKVLASAGTLPATSTPAPKGSSSTSASGPASHTAALAAAPVSFTSTTPAAAAQPASLASATPAVAAGSTFTGMAFDTCSAPSASSMGSWLASPYRSVGIYIGGAMRACGDGNLSSSWVNQVRSKGWGLLPLYVGLQAPCVDQSGLGTFSPSQAVAQANASATDAVSRAKFFGLGAGTPIYYDMEGYNTSVPGCSSSVATFISAWTSQLHRLGYTSGAYGSTSSLMVDLSRSVPSPTFVRPDDVWFANWNQLQTSSDSGSYPGFNNAYWSQHQRVHQYSGNATEIWGGVGLDIDANWVDATVAGTAVPVNYGTSVSGPGGAGFVLTGAMTFWRSATPAGLKRLAYWTNSNGSREYNGATWSLPLAPGLYNVQANIPSTNATANAPYTIRDALGTTHKVVNQAAVKGYTSLGTYTVRAGHPISVHVGDNDPSSLARRIGVDAMAFSQVAAAPSSPTAVSAVAGNGAAVVTWAAAAAHGSALTGYTVTASPGGATASVAGTTTSTAIAGLTNGTSYTFRLTATNAYGTSPSSAPSAAVTASTPLSGSPGVAPSGQGRDVRVGPVRLLDTRVGTTTNPVLTPVPAGSTLEVAVAGIYGSPVPGDARTARLNVTVLSAASGGSVSAVTTGPDAGPSLTFAAAQVVTKTLVADISPDGTVGFTNSSGGTIQLVVDVLGYSH